MTMSARRGRVRAAGVAALGFVSVLVAGTVQPAAAEPELAPWWYIEETGVLEAQADGYLGQGVNIAVIDSQVDVTVAELADATVIPNDEPYCDYPAVMLELFGVSGPAPTVATPFTTVNIDALAHTTSIVAQLVGNGVHADGVRGVAGVSPKATVRVYAAETGLPYPIGLPYVPDDRMYICEQEDADLSRQYTNSLEPFGWAIDGAVADGADIIVTASKLSALNGDFILEALTRAVEAGVIVVAAGSNDGVTLDEQLPPGAVLVRSFDRDGQIPEQIRVADERVTVAGPGRHVAATRVADDGSWEMVEDSGTSYTAPIVAGMLAQVMSKYPAATSGQVLQSLIRNTRTDSDDQTIMFDPDQITGYGLVDLPGMLAHDPTGYPDVNPLIGTPGVPVTVAPPVTATPEPEETTPDPVEPSPSSSSSVSDDPTPPASSATSKFASTPTVESAGEVGKVVAWVAAGLAVVVAVVLVVVLVSRRSRRGRDHVG